MWRRSSRFGRSFSSGSRFRGRPLAKVRNVWTTTLASYTLTSGPNALVLLNQSQWQSNTSAGTLEYASLRRIILSIKATSGASAVPFAARFALTVDDKDNNAATDPSTVSFYDDWNVVRMGIIAGPSLATGIEGPSYFGGRDYVHDYKCRERLSTDRQLWMHFEDIANDVTLSILARCLVQIGR